MKILVDMNLSPRWVETLAGSGLDAVHWSSIGPAEAPDAALAKFALENDFIILTYDLDFGALLAASRDTHPSVVQIRADNIAVNVIGDRVIVALRQLAVELAAGAMVTVEPDRMRMRLLPFD